MCKRLKRLLDEPAHLEDVKRKCMQTVLTVSLPIKKYYSKLYFNIVKYSIIVFS